MGLSDKEHELIEKSLKRLLSDDEQKNFDSLYSISDEFKRETELQRGIIQHLKVQLRTEKKKELLDNFRQFQRTQRKSRIKLYAGMAATFLLVATMSILLLTKDTTNDLFAKYYVPYDGTVITRGERDSISKAVYSYSTGNYENALELLLQQKDERPDQLLLIGNCYIALNNANEAVVWLSKIGEVESKELKVIRDWYIAMAHLKLGNKAECRKLLASKLIQNSIYRNKARALQDDLKGTN